MDWHQVLGIVAGLILLYSIVPYIKDMLQGTTRPNIVSWAIWTLLQCIAMVAQVSAGASWTIVVLIGCTFNTTLVTLLALTGYGYKKYGKLDWVCLGLALLAILLWYATNNPLSAIVLSVIADFFAAVPTVVKTYRDPASEIPLAWFLVSIACVLSIFATTIFDAANLIYPLYLMTLNIVVGSLALSGKRLKKRAQ